MRKVNFDDVTFPSVSELKAELENWNWIFGRTPKFKVIKHDLVNGEQYTCELHIVKGLVDRIDLFKNNLQLPVNCVPDSIIGSKLILDDCESGLNDWLTTRDDFQSVYFVKLILDTIKAIW